MATPVRTSSPWVQGDPGPFEEDRAVSPVPSNVSMRSDRSMGEPLHFRKGKSGPCEGDRSVSPVPSNVSMRSDRSMGEPLHFRKGQPGPFEGDRSVSPVPSNVSMRSDRSMGEPLHFRKGQPGPYDQERAVSPVPSVGSMESDRLGEPLDFSREEPDPFEEDRSVSPVPSNASMRSDRSMGEPLHFRKGKSGPCEGDRSVSPVPSNVSMRSDRSMGEPLHFRKGQPGPFEGDRSVSPVPSNVSMRSDRSMGEPLHFRKGQPSPYDQETAVSPVPSDVSVESDRLGEPQNISKGESGPCEGDRSVSPVPNDVSKKSDGSMGEPQNISKGESSPYDQDRSVSPVPSDVSVESDRLGEPQNISKGESGPCEGDRSVSAVPNDVSEKSDGSMGEPQNISKGESSPYDQDRSVSPVPSDVSVESDRLGEPQNISKGESGPCEGDRSVSAVPNDVSEKSDRSMGEPQNISKGESSPYDQERAVSAVPSDVSVESDRLSKPQNISKEGSGPCEGDRSFSSVPNDVSMKSDGSMGEPQNISKEKPGATDQNPDTTKPSSVDTSSKGKAVNPKLTADLKRRILSQHEEEVKKLETDTELYNIGKENKENKVQTYDELFPKSRTKTVRTVLMKGAAGVGKTLQTRRFMVDWAEGKSNKNIDLIVSLKFSELNSRKDEVQSMKDLLRYSLSDDEHPEVCKFDKCKDFRNELTADLKATIRHQHEEELKTLKRRQQLVSALRKRFRSENTEVENKDHPNQQNTEHIIREEKSNEVDSGEKSVTQVKATSDIFKDTKEKTIRTVLTIGEAGIGKSFHAQKFKTEWAKNDKGSYLTQAFNSVMSFWSKAEEEVIFPLDFSELNQMKETKVSLVGLLERFFKETKECVISNYEQFKVVFVLDGLEDYQPPLDFDNCNILTDTREPASVDVLLTNLIRGKLFPSARLWITSQPSAAKQLPDTCVDRTTEIRWKAVNPKLTADLKRRILSQHEEEVKKLKTDTELYDIGKENKENKVQTYDELFQKSLTKTVRTVLMKGAAGVGKTLQTRRFMVDWAEGKSNNNIDLIVSLKFGELNSRKAEVQSMKDLFHYSVNDDKHPEVCRFDDCSIAFVLDGLEECDLPLDFEKKEDLTDMNKPASMDVLLTNLIKGNLLPSAHLWIVSQPSGVEKIPSEYIQKQTECRGKDFKHELTADLKATIRHQHEEELRKHETDTELYEIGEENKDEKQTDNTLFLDSEQKTVRTVLMKGVPRVGKTHQTRRFMVDWAEEKSDKNIDLIVSLKFSELNSRKEKVQSMTDLLRHSLNDRKHRLACQYNKCEVAFVLDGLEECDLPLDFEKKEDLTDMHKPASMDVLLTNLIKGNLLPSARLWIVSQPSGVDKIPSEYIQKQTECRGMKQ
ncbi:uncharacterized protein [Pagrus major]|uniref:uncharacterized protein n=1 Tax=Pagrus major TaxID=143350 RepID=UPI003CC88308